MAIGDDHMLLHNDVDDKYSRYIAEEEEEKELFVKCFFTDL